MTEKLDVSVHLPTHDFRSIPTTFLADRTLTLAQKGLLSFIWARVIDEAKTLNTHQIAGYFKESRRTIRRRLNELSKSEYLDRIERPNSLISYIPKRVDKIDDEKTKENQDPNGSSSNLSTGSTKLTTKDGSRESFPGESIPKKKMNKKSSLNNPLKKQAKNSNPANPDPSNVHATSEESYDVDGCTAKRRAYINDQRNDGSKDEPEDFTQWIVEKANLKGIPIGPAEVMSVPSKLLSSPIRKENWKLYLHDQIDRLSRAVREGKIECADASRYLTSAKDMMWWAENIQNERSKVQTSEDAQKGSSVLTATQRRLREKLRSQGIPEGDFRE